MAINSDLCRDDRVHEAGGLAVRRWDGGGRAGLGKNNLKAGDRIATTFTNFCQFCTNGRMVARPALKLLPLYGI